VYFIEPDPTRGRIYFFGTTQSFEHQSGDLTAYTLSVFDLVTLAHLGTIALPEFDDYDELSSEELHSMVSVGRHGIAVATKKGYS